MKQTPTWLRLLLHADSMIFAILAGVALLAITFVAVGNLNPVPLSWGILVFIVLALALRGRDQGIAARRGDRGRWIRTLVKYALAIGVTAAATLYGSRAEAMSEAPAPAKVTQAALLSPNVTEAKTFAYCRLKIVEYEGVRLEAYMPTPDDRPTIGVGATHIDGKPVTMGMVITMEQAMDLLDEHMRLYRTFYMKALTEESRRTRLNTPRDCAFTSWTLNIGGGAAQRSTAIKRLNAGWIEGACDAMTWFHKQAGRPLPGLQIRRGKEWVDCMAGVSVANQVGLRKREEPIVAWWNASAAVARGDLLIFPVELRW
ncbi:GH24 family phage-related lysozyme (muramidase) [Maritimibacter alkaliphilus HTCC2654]|jgi:GH24 family phage-related lysozyme (muramidase)|uniref:Lysozyme n=1 Tax=Maritimibacter alkaliphilus HTCC2654 TaxID=314271 RepID=A3VBD6_9RHOB|nr:glycoside hydrolase family protein [Maritimibacter alkaliphilus]EAQ14269.1 probable phage-related lysozyme [Rhodobacterales bacterium HTCC2654] [Maritimibacter alkaliphilus HTCC2654]TYP78535.1 GH24 family phage-related lysozyme (muramidase) [Maritimibacter alkaliphilus HTCC2654]